MTSISRKEFIPSERQHMLLDFVADFTTRHGFPPTIREIVKHTDFASTSVVSYNA